MERRDDRELRFTGASHELAPIWRHLLDRRDDADVALLDAYSDEEHAGTLPDEVAAAMQQLRDRPTEGDRGMALRLDLDDAADRDLAGTFGPWSIHAEVATADGHDLFGVHDGTTLWVRGTPDELTDLRRTLAADDVTVLEPTRGRRPARPWWPLAVVAVLVVAAIALVVVGLVPASG